MDFKRINQTLTDGPCLAHYSEGKDNIVTTESNKIGLGIALWQKQYDGNIKPIEYGKHVLER